MNPRLNFYLFLSALTILDAVLLRSPNLIGKFGLLIYKYHYLRTFPKALLTVFLVVGLATVISETIRFAVKKGLVKELAGKVLFILLTTLAVALAIKVGLDFSSGSYARTGLRFRFGAYLLPVILIVVFVYGWLTTRLPVGKLPKEPLSKEPFPESQVIDEEERGSIK